MDELKPWPLDSGVAVDDELKRWPLDSGISQSASQHLKRV